MPAEHLIAVFQDRTVVDRLSVELDELGVGMDVGQDADVRDELRAEMAEEAGGSGAAPGMPPMNKEIMKAAGPATVIGTVLGAIVLIPAAIPAWGDLPFAARLIWVLIIGAFAGGTVGVLLGGALGSRAANRKLAAERGVVVSVHSTEDRVVDLLASHQPIRLDRVRPDGTFEVLQTEEDSDPDLYRDRMEDNLRGTDRSDE